MIYLTWSGASCLSPLDYWNGLAIPCSWHSQQEHGHSPDGTANVEPSRDICTVQRESAIEIDIEKERRTEGV